MAEFIHSILRTDALVTADGDEVVDLPVNPLSVILIKISPLNDTATIGDYALLREMLSAVDTIRVSHKGSAVFNMSGIDAAVMAFLYHRIAIWQSNAVEIDNQRRAIILPILFGRKAYLGTECFPETRKGELQLTITWDIADTGFDGLRRSVETIELPEAAPVFVEKKTTLAQTFAATGQNDVEVPIGNAIRALLLFGTTRFLGAAPAPTWAQIEVLKDNKQFGFTSTDWETSRSIAGLLGVSFPPDLRHIHSLNGAVAAADASDLATAITLVNEIKADLNNGIDVLEPQIGGSLDANYTLLSYDPLRDDSFLLETEGAGRVNVRATAESADAVRVIPVERVNAAEFVG